MRRSRYLVPALLFTLICHGERQETNFDSPPVGWTATGGAILAEPLGNKYLHLASVPGSIGMPTLTTTQRVPLLPGGKLEITFRYRSDIEDSGMHRGAWVFLQFFDASGKAVTAEYDGFALWKAETWCPFKGNINVPLGATHVQAQIRVQNSPGKFLDIDDLKTSCSPGVPPADPLKNPDLVALATFVLQPNATLKSEGETLKNLSPPAAAPSFRLPDSYCERPEYSYGLSATFTADIEKNSSGSFPAVFSLGSVFAGSDAQSMEAAFVGRNLMFRVRCDRNSDGMEWSFPVDCAHGKSAVATALLGRNELQASTGGPWKQVASSTPFTWEKGRIFRVGSPNTVNVQQFTLTVFKPSFMAALEEGPDGGLFHGEGTHPWGIAFPEGGGKRAKLAFAITDFFRKEYAAPNLAQATDNAVSFTLPKLPYGWYRLNVQIELDGCARTIGQSFVVTPEPDKSLPACESPLGITQGFALDKDTFSAGYVERLFRASAAAGNRWFRLWTTWDNVEREPGKRDWSVMDQVIALAQKNNLELYINLTGGNLPWQTSHEPGTPKVAALSGYLPRDLSLWSDFVTAFASRYRETIGYFQIGNESDTQEFFQPFSAESYMKFLKAGHQAVKKGNPDAKVGLCGFAAAFGMLETPKMKPGDRIFGAREFWDLNPEPFYDIVDCHFYSLGAINFFWDSYTKTVPRFLTFLEQRGESKKPLWNSETGFPSGIKGERGGYDSSPMISDYEQACRLVEWHIQSQSVNVQRSFNYLVTGTSGLFQGDFTPKPSCAASANLARMLSDRVFKRKLPLAGDLYGYEFASRKGSGRMVVAWSRTGPLPVIVTAAPGASVAKIDLFGNRSPLLATDGVALATLDVAPIYFVSDLPFEVARQQD